MSAIREGLTADKENAFRSALRASDMRETVWRSFSHLRKMHILSPCHFAVLFRYQCLRDPEVIQSRRAPTVQVRNYASSHASPRVSIRQSVPHNRIFQAVFVFLVELNLLTMFIVQIYKSPLMVCSWKQHSLRGWV